MRKRNSMRESLIKFLNGTMYIGMIYGIIYAYVRFVLNNHAVDIIDKVALALIGIVFGLWLFICQQESLEDDSKTAKDMFSINISLVALVVSMIALLKGV